MVPNGPMKSSQNGVRIEVLLEAQVLQGFAAATRIESQLFKDRCSPGVFDDPVGNGREQITLYHFVPSHG